MILDQLISDLKENGDLKRTISPHAQIIPNVK